VELDEVEYRLFPRYGMLSPAADFIGSRQQAGSKRAQHAGEATKLGALGKRQSIDPLLCATPRITTLGNRGTIRRLPRAFLLARVRRTPLAGKERGYMNAFASNWNYQLDKALEAMMDERINGRCGPSVYSLEAVPQALLSISDRARVISSMRAAPSIEKATPIFANEDTGQVVKGNSNRKQQFGVLNAVFDLADPCGRLVEHVFCHFPVIIACNCKKTTPVAMSCKLIC
jgi:hypothetical protein